MCRRPWLFIVGAVAVDMTITPWTLWSGPYPYRPTLLLEGFLRNRTELKALAGEWFLIHFLVAFALLLWWSNRKASAKAPEDASHYGSHGTTRFARPQELRTYLHKDGPGLIMGSMVDGQLILPRDPMLPFNQNVTVLGSSGTRKTRSFVQPNLLQEAQHGEGSIICVDPKGENYRRSASLLKEAGCDVRLLNFLEMAHSDRWNPLATVKSTMDAADLAVNLVANTINPNRPVGGDPFWDQAEQSFITALVLYVKHHRPEAEQHMASVLELGAELHPNNLDYLFQALPKEAPARRFYRTFLRADEKVRAGVVAGIGSRLQLWNIPDVAALTGSSDLNLAELGSRRIALFLVIPDSKATYAPILALFWQQTFQVLYDLADRNGGALPVPVRCVMDEIANCGYIPDYALKKSTMRSRSISTEEIWQNLTQLKNRYAHTWAELLANSDHLLLLGANDLETAQYISQLSGTTTINIMGTGNTDGTTGGSTSMSRSYTGRPLVTPDECRRLPLDEALLFPRGNYPARIQKVDYTSHPLANDINELDHRAYPAPTRTDLVVTNVDLLLASVLPQEPKSAGKGAEADQPHDPSDFADDVFPT
jgi:type IV secretion system protein VirD4